MDGCGNKSPGHAALDVLRGIALQIGVQRALTTIKIGAVRRVIQGTNVAAHLAHLLGVACKSALQGRRWLGRRIQRIEEGRKVVL